MTERASLSLAIYFRDCIVDEHLRAANKFPKFASLHEGYAILKEEVDELWDEIKGEQRPEHLREEAMQVAAMALRFLVDLC